MEEARLKVRLKMSMPTIERYYLKGFFKLFLIISIGLSFILSVLELIEKLDEFMRNGSEASDMLLYAIYSFPKYLSYLMPLSALLSSLFVLGQASRRKEIVAVMASGGRIRRLLLPFVYVGVILSLVGFGLSEFVVPSASKRAKDIKSEVTKTVQPLFREGTVWLRADDGSIVRMDIYLPDRELTKGMSIFKIKGGTLSQRIEAEEAVYESGSWVLKNVRIFDIANASLNRLSSMKYPYLESPKSLMKEIKKPEEMGIVEHIRYVRKLQKAGLGNTKLVVDMNSKMSYPLINLFMLIIGISFSVRRGLHGLLSSGIGLLISLLYWFGFTMALSLGYAGILPAILSAWIMPFIFSIASVYLFMTIPE